MPICSLLSCMATLVGAFNFIGHKHIPRLTHTFSQGSGNLPLCVNVAVNIGCAFQGPELCPSFVCVDSRVEVAVKNGCALQRAGFAMRLRSLSSAF